MSLPLIRSYYGVPAWRGRDITVDGKPCVIIGSATGTMHLRVRFTDGSVASAHPTWRVDYRDRVSTLRRLVHMEPHFLNQPLTDAEVAEWEALEVGE